MAGRHAVIGWVLAKPRIGRDVVGTDRALTLKGRPEHSRVARVGELGKGFPRRARESMEEIGELMEQLDDLDRRIKKLDAMIVTLCRTNETCRRLAKLPGVGPVIATAIVGSVNDGRQFRSGREMAAWIGLVPRQYTTGGKPRLGGIGRRANHYLRRQLIHGARATVSRSAKHDDRQSTWLKALVARRGFNRTIVALANKTARIAWVLLSRKEEYAAP